MTEKDELTILRAEHELFIGQLGEFEEDRVEQVLEYLIGVNDLAGVVLARLKQN